MAQKQIKVLQPGSHWQCLYAFRDQMTDILLYTDGGIIHTHKTLLSICSPIFREIIENTPGNAIFLKDISFPGLSIITNFLYSGHIITNADQLIVLKDIARSLQIEPFLEATQQF